MKIKGENSKWVHESNDGETFSCGKSVFKFQLPIEKTEQAVNCEWCLAQIHVKTLQAGQPRRYADSVYKFEITDLTQEKRTKDEMLDIALKFVKKSIARDEMPHPFAPERKSFYERSPGVWFYHVNELYTG